MNPTFQHIIRLDGPILNGIITMITVNDSPEKMGIISPKKSATKVGCTVNLCCLRRGNLSLSQAGRAGTIIMMGGSSILCTQCCGKMQA